MLISEKCLSLEHGVGSCSSPQWLLPPSGTIWVFFLFYLCNICVSIHVMIHSPPSAPSWLRGGCWDQLLLQRPVTSQGGAICLAKGQTVCQRENGINRLWLFPDSSSDSMPKCLTGKTGRVNPKQKLLVSRYGNVFPSVRQLLCLLSNVTIAFESDLSLFKAASVY